MVNPAREKGIPLFLLPRSKMSLAALPHLAAENNPKKDADITAGKSLIERLIELGLKKKVLPAKRTKKWPASVEAGRFFVRLAGRKAEENC